MIAQRRLAAFLAQAFGGAAVWVLTIGRPAEAQAPYMSTIQATTNVAVPFADNRVQDTGQLDGRAGTAAMASDKFTSMPITLGPVPLGTISAQVSSTVTEGSIKLFGDLSITADPNNPFGGLGFSAGLTGSAFDFVQITNAPAGGAIAIADVINPLNTAGNIGGSGSSWSGNLGLNIAVEKYPADGTGPAPAGNVMRTFSAASGQSPTATDSGPDRIPVQKGDTLTFDAEENLNLTPSASDGQTTEVRGDFGHTTHIYIWSLTPGLEFTAGSGHDYSPVPGDASLDGQVNFADLVIVARNYGRNNVSWEQGDFNNDGSVGFDDLVILARNYGQGVTAAELARLDPAFRGDVEAAFASIPEPSMLLTLMLSAVFLRRRIGT